MFGSQVLEVGIGMAMLFALMSLIASALQEYLETLLKVRADHLEQAIRNILDDPRGTNKVVDKFFNDPMISILYNGKYDSAKLDTRSSDDSARGASMPRAIRANLPSYIPSANFALAVLRMASGGSVANAPAKAADIRANINIALGSSPQLQGIVLQALDTAKDDINAAQKQLEAWFDNAMERVSGWYKKYTHWCLFAIGLFAAVVVNVDAITVARSLMNDPVMRQAIVSKAANAKEGGDLATSRQALNDIGYPIGWTDIPQIRLGLHGGGIAGQNPCATAECFRTLFRDDIWTGAQSLLAMALGWLITAFAVTFGAPFWFDLLSKFMQLRTAVKPEPKTSGGK
jgi:hypothetical protein